MKDFQKFYTNLNDAQKTAVDNYEGPMLVLAGPGTGKTQLISARVAKILSDTDTLPQNILCMTFTNNGAHNMRERLVQFIGKDAYDVEISTYHAFGADLISRFGEYFTQTRVEKPVDEIGKYQIVQSIIENLSYDNPLKNLQYNTKDLISTISELKRGLLDAKTLKQIAKENLLSIEKAGADISEIFADFKSMPRKLENAAPYFDKTLKLLNSAKPAKPASKIYGSLIEQAESELKQAIEEAQNTGKTKPITAWKNKWLAKDINNNFIIKGETESRKILALFDVLEEYENRLAARGLYDYEDMILRSIKALEENDDFKFTLQEQYLYILLDEFQDTNAVQLRLIELLTDNPVHEGKPNIMAVGDDDQAIFAFQGARYSNLREFKDLYEGTKVVNLTDNYRSHPDILHIAHNISSQIEARIHHDIKGIAKTLKASAKNLPKEATIERHEFISSAAENNWIAQNINQLISDGVNPSEIAVIAPKHKFLEDITPYLSQLSIPVNYEKRENILESPIVQQLLTMSRLAYAMSRQKYSEASVLWPEVLSYDFWGLPVDTVWKTSWKVRKDRADKSDWTKELLDNPETESIAKFFMYTAGKAGSSTVETIIDWLIGNEPISEDNGRQTNYKSPFKDYYTSKEQIQYNPELFYMAITHLRVLRDKLREYQSTHNKPLRIKDLIEFVDLYISADLVMINDSPYKQHSNALQMMTAYGAKGLEFEHVFIPSCVDEVWGSKARGNPNKLALPANLEPIRHTGSTEDEKLRLLFVAMTRAKHGIYMTSYQASYTGKPTNRLKYFAEAEGEDGKIVSGVLPANFSEVRVSADEKQEAEVLETGWRVRHLSGIKDPSLNDLLHEKLETYQLSPTHLNKFTDMVHGGPEKFFFENILQFPSAPTSSGQFGNAIHSTLEWLQHQFNRSGEMPDTKSILNNFEQQMQSKNLEEAETKRLIERGFKALSAYLDEAEFHQGFVAEKDFKNEGVLVGDAHMAGKIDRLEIDKKNRTITVVDYKTGKSYSRWRSNDKLHKFAQQLYCYKLLVEGSHSYKGYEVTSGRLEFIEPDDDGRINMLEMSFKKDELERVKQLLVKVWSLVQSLEFPDTSQYTQNLKGTKKFQEDLINGREIRQD